jgi:Polyketide cyclase / dehydrase and lipid transport
MGQVVVTRHLAATPAELWSIVIDPRTWGDWFTVHDRWLNCLPASLAEGTGLAAKVVLLGVANRMAWTVESVVAPTSLVLVGTGSARLAARCVFAMGPAETGSWFTFAGDLEGTLVRGALVKAVERDCAKQVEMSLTLLEALAAPPRTGAPKITEPVRPRLRLVHSAASAD